MAAKRCPVCRLVSPESALVCECGWSFAQQTMTDSPLAVAKRGAAATSRPWLLPLCLWLGGSMVSRVGSALVEVSAGIGMIFGVAGGCAAIGGFIGLIIWFFRWLSRRNGRLRQARRAEKLEAAHRAAVVSPERRD